MGESNNTNRSVDSINVALRSLYESRLPEFNEQIEQCINECGWEEVSKLFFMQVDEDYLNAPTKVLFVGRETYGWWGEHSEQDKVENLMGCYKETSNLLLQTNYLRTRINSAIQIRYGGKRVVIQLMLTNLYER
ncbi:hypothetical protein M0L20_01400 [Spirosoma sp. RP8]|uniref:Uncharacterized protein n=1 Tax=Spirosoma liriopis TaxID=2937440 RepID=A0ABT0HE95_9BACT|nr:hypothetical protein [Spirosoma liriopis]MCK8490484.1 hypothetical protein [Spirosoma liriopis]